MRVLASFATALACLAAPLSAAATKTPSKSTTAKKPKRRAKAPAPKVSAKDRAKATAQVSEWTARSTPIENPEALSAFFARLKEAGGSSVRALQYGDSHTAADSFTNVVRAGLQAQFGDGGIGFGFAGRPFIGYRRIGSPATASKGWKAEGLTRGTGEGPFGLGGVSLTTARAGETLSLQTSGSHFEVQFLRQPQGGRIEISLDGTAQIVDTSGEPGPGSAAVDIADGEHRLEIRTLDPHPVHLWGWVADRASGVTYENIGINGAQASLMLLWDEASHVDQLAHRAPALVVMAYGTNEAGVPDWTDESYYESLTAAVKRIRKAVPNASVLLLGPPDREARQKGRWLPMDRLNSIVAIQRRVAREQNAAFWDQRAQMGGSGSIHTWYQAGLAQPDHVHFTEAGYAQLGQLFSRQLIEPGGREAAIAAHAQPSGATHGQRSENSRDPSQSHQ